IPWSISAGIGGHFIPKSGGQYNRNLQNDTVMLAMAVDTTLYRTRVLNASWGNVLLDSFHFELPGNLSYLKYAEGAYNEIYEHGVSVVAGAGNGKTTEDTSGRPWTYTYPAAFDHNLAISTIGHHNSSGVWNVENVHELHVGDSLWECHAHNLRVDLCAPGYMISSTYFSPTSPDKYKYRYASGTSFSAPLVAGTIGLMYSKMKWLTPYQIEYVLKKSSRDIYSIPANQKYAYGPSRHTGRIGSGALDAGAALEMLDTDVFFADHPDARTFRVKGATITHRCRPGARPGLPKPVITVHMENGTPPYTYKWERLAVVFGAPQADGVTLSPRIDRVGTNQITATIDSAWGPGTLYYRLTVYDNSEIQKVANKVFRMSLINDTNRWDLAMQDSYADLYDEPNTMLQRSPLDWDIWSSHDVWNRYFQDGDTTHQDPDINVAGTQYMHARVRNVGCKESPDGGDNANLEFYWTVAATGERWPQDWAGTSSAINGQPPGGFIGNVPIPALAPGASTILSHDWIPPNPTLYDTTNLLTRIDICALARITGSSSSPFGMTFAEIDTSKVNILNNNNLVTKNFVSLNLTIGSPNTPSTGVVIRNPSGGNTPGNPPKGTGSFSVELATQNQLAPFVHGHLANYIEGTILLGDLYDVWEDGGKMGHVSGFDDDLKTVSWNLESPLRLDNLEIDENEQYYVILTFNLKSGLTSIPYEIKDQLIHLRLLTPREVDVDNGDGTTLQVTRDYIHSAVNYSINIQNDGAGEEKRGRINGINNLMEGSMDRITVYPNPVNGEMTIVLSESGSESYDVGVTDISGKIVYERHNVTFMGGEWKINTGTFTPGTYQVHITDKTGKAFVHKFIKLDN
ncbi:S8 family serine peptidase, partial [Parapedobacter sp. 2B3]|uniref:S8 family serine peptidase n=1 Tax=Parapedobacter sp. 2B3 TaxID=3342381 RepID=UPI0035B69A54